MRQKRGPRKGKGRILDTLRDTCSQNDVRSPVAQLSSPVRHHSIESVPIDLGVTSSPVLDQSNDAVPIDLGITSNTFQPVLTTSDTSNVLPLDSYFSFDDFARNILADNSYLAHDTPGNVDVFGDTPHTSSGTPGGLSMLETPHTGIATTIALPTQLERFEVTPVIQRSVQLWFEHQYPTYPVLSQDKVNSWLQDPQPLSKSVQTLFWAMSAMSLVMIDRWPDLGGEQRAVACRQFIQKCRQLRLEWNYMEQPTYEDSLVSLFIANAYFELKCRKTSWSFVRQAITIASAANMHNDIGYIGLSDDEVTRRRRAFALLFITERGAAIQDNFPVSLFVAPSLPTNALPSEDPSVIGGLLSLHGLFSLLDFKFVKLWNDAAHAVGDDIFLDLSALQHRLSTLSIDTTGLNDIQKADILITQQWLRLIFWQTALRLGYISTAAADPAFTYNYPVEIAMALCNVVKSIPPIAIQVHGLGIFEKQFEIAYSLMDTLALSGPTQAEHHECLRYLLLSLSASPSSRQIYVRTLEKKMDSQQKYRNLAGVELLRDDSGGSRQNSRRGSLAVGLLTKRARVSAQPTQGDDPNPAT